MRTLLGGGIMGWDSENSGGGEKYNGVKYSIMRGDIGRTQWERRI